MAATFPIVRQQALQAQHLTTARDRSRTWDIRATAYLDFMQLYANQHVPQNYLQMKLDAAGHSLDACLQPIKDFDQACRDAWRASAPPRTGVILYDLLGQLARMLIALPFQMARQVVRQVYLVLKQAARAVVHPIDAANQLARLLISLAKLLLRPETYVKVGVGLLTGSLVSGLLCTPISVLRVTLGTILALSGLAAGSILAALQAHEGYRANAAAQYLATQANESIEIAVQAVLLSLIFNFIQQRL